MSLFLRLVTLRSVLFLIAGCVLENGVIQLVLSDLSVGYTIQIGELTSKEAQENAVAKLSNGPYQQIWWKLTDVQWRRGDSAIRRFFDAGPLLPSQMTRLAENSGKPDPWGTSNIVSSDQTYDLMAALQRLSTANYKMNKWITGTGQIEASMWTILFFCKDGSSCNEGYFVPIVTIPKDENADQQQQPTNSGCKTIYQYSYAALFQSLTDNLVVNAIPAFIGRLPPATNHCIDGVDPDLSIVINTHDTVPQCANTTAVGYRSLLDASYGLVPGSACIKFSQAEQFNLLVFLGQASVNSTQSSVKNFTSFIYDSLQVNETEHWEPRTFEECSTAMVLLGFQDYPNEIFLCDHNSKICSSAYAKGNATCMGVDHLRFLQSVTSLSKSCTYNDYAGKPTPLDYNLVQMPWTEVSCTKCEALVNFYDMELVWNFFLFSPQSNWTSTEGHNTSEFSHAPNMTEPRTCIRNFSSTVVTNTSQIAFLDAIQIRARANLNSFIAEHSLTFTTTQGPATDLANFLALVVSTAISVILGISGPFTNFLLRNVCKWRPLHLDSRRGTVRKVVKVLFQMLCNVLLSFCSFLPVMYLAWTEYKREELFNTWDLGSEDQYIYSPIQDVQLRVVYLLSATSQYRSHFINLSAGVVCGSCALVGGCSAWRVRDVLDRYTLLQKYDSIQAGKGPVISRTDITEDRETLYARALKAIDMTDGDELNIKAEVSRHENAQELGRRGQATTESAPAGISSLLQLIITRRPEKLMQYSNSIGAGPESSESQLLPVDFIPSA